MKPAARGTVLLIEDESLVRDFLTRALERGGYSVLAVPDGAAALAALAGDAGKRIRLLVCDEGLPDIRGRELVLRARRQRPDLKALLISGAYLSEKVAEGFAILPKPFDIRTLEARLRALLG